MPDIATNKILRLAIAVSALGTIAAAMISDAVAQDVAKYPERAVRLIIPFPPGAGNDILGREIANGLSTSLGRTFTPENQAGAGGIIGIAAIGRSKPDGYTIGIGSTSTLAINPAMQSDLQYKVDDFTAITNLAQTPYILTIGKARSFKTVQELIAFAKANPNVLTYGSAGIGTTNHLAGAIFAAMAGIQLKHVPYAGANNAVNDTVGGQIDMTFAPILNALPMMQSGTLKPLGVTALERSPAAPDVPTIAEAANLPGYSVTNWYGVIAPATTPKPIIDKLNEAIVKIMNDPKIKKELQDQGATIVADTPDHFAATIKDEAEKWKAAVKTAGLGK